MMPLTRSFRRRALLLSLACAGIAAGLTQATAEEVEIPLRKPGLWEMKTTTSVAERPAITMQQCTDATTDKQMSTSFSPMSREACSKREFQKTPTGYSSDAVCKFGNISSTSHSEITGDFNSAYTVKVTSHREGGPAAMPHDATITIEAKWLGPCKPGQKPGDMVMPGGFKININQLDKLKKMMPK